MALVDYRSRPLYIAYSIEDDETKEVIGLLSFDEQNWFVALEGRWFGNDDIDAMTEVEEASLHLVPEEDKVFVVNKFMTTQGIGADGLSAFTVDELLADI